MSPTSTPSPFGVPVHITYIGTATSLIHLPSLNITLLTDPYFSPAPTTWDVGIRTLTSLQNPGLSIPQLPPIDAVLLSHEDHVDNLDPISRPLLDGRTVFTTVDGARKLAPRPGVRGMKAWEEVKWVIGRQEFTIIATPCEHLDGGEATGFLLSHPSFGHHPISSLPNAIWFTGDTSPIPSLAPSINKKFHVSIMLANLGAAKPFPELQKRITLSAQDALDLVVALDAEVLVPLHFEGWTHFTEEGGREETERVFGEMGKGWKERVWWGGKGEVMKVV